jgi:hypothetical protein
LVLKREEQLISQNSKLMNILEKLKKQQKIEFLGIKVKRIFITKNIEEKSVKIMQM